MDKYIIVTNDVEFKYLMKYIICNDIDYKIVKEENNFYLYEIYNKNYLKNKFMIGLSLEKLIELNKNNLKYNFLMSYKMSLLRNQKIYNILL